MSPCWSRYGSLSAAIGTWSGRPIAGEGGGKYLAHCLLWREIMKKIEFITQDDPLYVLPLFGELLRAYSGEFEITRLSCCRVMGSRPRRRLLKELLLLY